MQWFTVSRLSDHQELTPDGTLIAFPSKLL